MDVLFDRKLEIKPIRDFDALAHVFETVALFKDPRSQAETLHKLQLALRPKNQTEMHLYGSSSKLSVGIKRLLLLTEMARQDPERMAKRLVKSMEEMAVGSPPKIGKSSSKQSSAEIAERDVLDSSDEEERMDTGR